jgi:hypothetical protein
MLNGTITITAAFSPRSADSIPDASSKEWANPASAKFE